MAAALAPTGAKCTGLGDVGLRPFPRALRHPWLAALAPTGAKCTGLGDVGLRAFSTGARRFTRGYLHRANALPGDGPDLSGLRASPVAPGTALRISLGDVGLRAFALRRLLSRADNAGR